MKMSRVLGITASSCLLAIACGKNEPVVADAGAQTATAPAASVSAIESASAQHPSASAPQAIPAPPDVGAPPADAKKTSSGLASKVLTPGTGHDHPGPT